MTGLTDTNLLSHKRLYSPVSQKAKHELQDALNIMASKSDIKAIALTRGEVALVDADVFDMLMQWEWQCRDGYAKRGARGRKAIAMHNIIMNPPEGFIVDHIDGNGLNNRRSNLRVCKQKHNTWNRKPVKGSSSKYKGVSWQAATGYWKAYIKTDGKQKHLGCYLSEEEAAIAYNRAAKELHGEFAKLNNVEDKPCLTKLKPRW